MGDMDLFGLFFESSYFFSNFLLYPISCILTLN
jgi:hypothetical protein